MNMENICHVIPKQEDHDPIQIVNFVYETDIQQSEEMHTIPTFRLHYVMEGEGLLYMPGVVQTIRAGDVFVVFPNAPYNIEAGKNLKFGFIGYLGHRARVLKEKMKLTQNNCVFHGFEDLLPAWKRTQTMPQEVFNLYCESLLLQIFADIGAQLYKKKEHVRQETNAGELIKKYIDENYADPGLTLEKVGDYLGYHRKYVSLAFREEFDMGFTNYVNSVRVHQACILMEQGFTSVQDIAAMCGFNDPYYFSRVFKDHMNVSPKAHMETLEKGEKKNGLFV